MTPAAMLAIGRHMGSRNPAFGCPMVASTFPLEFIQAGARAAPEALVGRNDSERSRHTLGYGTLRRDEEGLTVVSNVDSENHAEAPALLVVRS